MRCTPRGWTSAPTAERPLHRRSIATCIATPAKVRRTVVSEALAEIERAGQDQEAGVSRRFIRAWKARGIDLAPDMRGQADRLALVMGDMGQMGALPAWRDNAVAALFR